jgi:hypothetical protein
VEHVDAFATKDVVLLRGGDVLNSLVRSPHRLGKGRTSGGGLDERLRRHAAGERALPADRPVLDQQSPSFPACTGAGCTDSAGAAPDDDEVVVVLRDPGAHQAARTP